MDQSTIEKAGSTGLVVAGDGVAAGTHFTCFTGTKVQILTQLRPTVRRCKILECGDCGAHFTCFTLALLLLYGYKSCFTGTKRQILTLEMYFVGILLEDTGHGVLTGCHSLRPHTLVA
jgi:hypothetical protein